MLEGLIWTFTLVSGGLLLGFTIGLPLALAEVYGGEYTRTLVKCYIWFFRGVPLLVLLFLFYWGVFPSLGLKLAPLSTSIIVLGLRSGAYQSEIFRSAIQAIGEGQILAAEALGMNRLQAILYIVIPQILRIAIPAWSNEYAIILKDSAICFTLGVAEILTRARYVVITTGVALIPYLIAGVSLMILTYFGVKVLDRIYSRVKIPGLGVSLP